MLVLLRRNELRDAGLISSLQRLEHYEIAACGSVAALAGQMGFRDDQKILHQNLEDNKRFDALLTRLAKDELNRNALSGAA
jgi:ferritin-like metal-binding protein YciE